MSPRERWDNWLAGLEDRFGGKRVAMFSILILVGLASVVIRLLIGIDLDQTALLYLAVPYGVAVIITLFRPYEEHEKWWQGYISHSVTALVVFLGSSVVLFEGFICILFFAPIYFFAVTIAFIAHWITIKVSERRTRTYASVIPLMVAVFSLEGTTEITTFERQDIAVATAITTLAPEQLLHNLAMPIELSGSSDWMLGLFPMPQRIDAGSLQVGDVHRVYTRYHRWFFTNTHEGEIRIRIDSVSQNRVTTSIIHDTSYFSSYVTLHGSEFEFEVNERGETLVSLAVHYERRLDPAWYFRPIQQYAMRQMAAHLIQEVLIRE